MPCIFIAAPCVFVGSFLLKAGKEAEAGGGGSWGAIAGTTLAVASLGQCGAMVIAAYYMTEVMNMKGDELSKPRPEHKPIEDMTKAEQHFWDTYAEVTGFSTMNSCYRRLLCTCTFMFLLSGFLLVIFDKECFRPFSLTSKIGDKIEDGGLNGSVKNIFKFLGVVAVALFFVACMLFKIFTGWAKGETAKRVASVSPDQRGKGGEDPLDGVKPVTPVSQSST